MTVPYPENGSIHWGDPLKNYIDAQTSEGSLDAAVSGLLGDSGSDTREAVDTQVGDAVNNAIAAEEARSDAAYAPMASLTGLDPWLYDSTRGRNFKIHYADALENPCDILCIGDSVTEGYGATTIANRWENLLVQRLRNERGQTTGGEGYVPAFYETPTDPPHADRFTGGTFTTSGSLFGLGIRCIRLTAGTSSFTFTGTGVDVFFAVGTAAGQFTWNIDGGTESAANSTYSANNQGGCCFISARGLTPGAHTVNITHATATIYIEGAMVYDGDEDHGVRVIEAAHHGYQAYSFAVIPYWSTSITPINIPWALPTATVTGRRDPALVAIMLGINDYGTGAAARRTPAQMRADLITIIGLIRTNTLVDPTIMLMIPWERSTPVPPAPLATWAEYRQVYFEVAAQDGQVGICDLGPTIGSFVGGDPYDLDVNDGIHLSDKGYRVVADAIYQTLVTA